MYHILDLIAEDGSEYSGAHHSGLQMSEIVWKNEVPFQISCGLIWGVVWFRKRTVVSIFSANNSTLLPFRLALIVGCGSKREETETFTLTFMVP